MDVLLAKNIFLLQQNSAGGFSLFRVISEGFYLFLCRHCAGQVFITADRPSCRCRCNQEAFSADEAIAAWSNSWAQ